MNVYIAAAMSRMEWARTFAAQLRLDGHQVVSEWHAEDGGTNPTNQQATADMCLCDLNAANVLVTRAETPAAGYLTGGRHVEFGYAIARNIARIVIGEPENVFHHFTTDIVASDELARVLLVRMDLNMARGVSLREGF